MSQTSISPPTKISIVLPVRDRELEIAIRIENVLEGLVDLTSDIAEIVVVDDGSRDNTPEVLEDLRGKYPQVRIARHQRPRGMEAAGQTGLERAIGELVFIQESDSDLRIDDLRRLLTMSDDQSVIAARAESCEEPVAPSLVRRLQQWGGETGKHLETQELRVRADRGIKRSLQMIRRPHLQRLAGEQPGQIALEGKTERIKTLRRAVPERSGQSLTS